VPTKKTSKSKPKAAAGTRSNSVPLRQSMFSRPLMVAFAAIFVVIGGYIIYAASSASSVELKSGISGNYCLDDHGDGGNGSEVDAWACNGSAAQHFSFSGNLLHVGAGCAYVEGASATTGYTQARVVIGPCTSVPWGAVWTQSGSTFTNNHADSKGARMCLDIKGGKPEATAEIYSCNGGSNQKWTETSYSSGGGSTPPPTTSSYKNPFLSVSGLSFERVDQGVDFGGSGPVHAIGDGVIDYIYAPAGSGWGANNIFIKYRFSDGSKSGQYVYVAEDCTPKVSMGEKVNSGTVICDMYNGSSGIETGWAQASGDLPLTQGGGATSGGYSFQSFLESLGVHM
jgi:hypothetical protein